MRYAIFSDIHSNLEALVSFFHLVDLIEDLQPICLGDIVGYAAHPNQCLALIRERGIPTVIGNHDYAILDPLEAEAFNSQAKEVIQWQRRIIQDDYKRYMYGLPWIYVVDDAFAITHSSFFRPEEFRYLHTTQNALDSFLNMPTRIGFFGHTHIPAVFTFDASQRFEKALQYEMIRGNNHTLTLNPDLYYLINPGSIGQPRDKDPRASFVIFDSESKTVTFRRFPYDYEREAADIRKASLPEMFADRLRGGY